jgi:hypothetical protein
MSIEHFNAAWRCRKFKGSVRLLLLTLANRASDGKPSKTGKPKPKYGWSFAGMARLMMDINASTRDTVIDGMRTLREAGVVTRQRRVSNSSLSFVDIEVLKSLAYTDEDESVFERKANAKVGKSTTSGQNAKGKTLPLDVGKNTTTNVGKSTTSDVGKITTAVVGNFPPYNNQRNPKIDNIEDDEPSASESELADSDSDCSFDKQDLKESEDSESEYDLDKSVQDEDHDDYPVEENEACPVEEEQDSPDLDGLYNDEFPAQNKVSHPAHESAPVGRPTPRAAAVPLPDGSAPDPQEYEDAVYLCSLWWATHDDTEEQPEPEARIDPNSPEHPRNWNPEQRREAFLILMAEGDDPDDLACHPPACQDDPDPENDSAPDDSGEQNLLRDEGNMLALYLEHGRETIEEVLRWLPCSNNPVLGTIKTVGALRASWKLVSEQYDRYIDKATENGTEDRCHEWIEKRFAAAGGDAAEWLCHLRLHPVDQDDAAEEEEMDAAEDAYGHDVFSPWVEDDYQEAIAALKAREAGLPYDEEALAMVAGWDGWDDTIPEEESDLE